MKRLAFALATLAILLWSYSPARASVAPGEEKAGGSTTVVYPTGQHPVDVNNVRAAVRAGGNVLLKATDAAGVFTPFNFGPAVAGSGTVFLNTDVSVRGETVAGRMTTITGGDTPFRIYKAVESAFEELNFEGPRMTAVLVAAAARFEFRRSRVARVVPFHWYTAEDGVDIYKGQGLWVAVAGASSGAIVIEDNVFEDCGLGGAQLGYGLALVTGDAPLRVARNIIRGANFAGIILILPGAETVIEENIIVTGPGDIEPRFSGNGIHLLGAWDRVQDAPVRIRKNDVRVEGPEAVGIHAFGDEVYNYKVQNLSVEKNDITVTDGLAGIGLWGEVVGAEVRNNRLRGGAQYAMLLGAGFFDPTEQSVGNEFVGNNIATFGASVADVFFDTNTLDNVLKGHSGTVIDLGIGNVITGSRKGLPVHAEEQLRSAQRSMQRRPGLSEPTLANRP